MENKETSPIVNLDAIEIEINKEPVPSIKKESYECVVCTGNNTECVDILLTNTKPSSTPLHQFLGKYSHVNISEDENVSKNCCQNCLNIINLLEEAELQYLKLKEEFVTIIGQNPLFDNVSSDINIKTENILKNGKTSDSEDEPLAVAKRKRRKERKKSKKKDNDHTLESWVCNVCGETEEIGGAVALAAHSIAKHGLCSNIKQENVEISYDDNNDSMDIQHDDTCSDSFFKEELDEDISPALEPDDSSGKPSKRKVPRLKKSHLKSKEKRPQAKKKEAPSFGCDDCGLNFKTSSRLLQHRSRCHESKPPYICEVCGAHYKHKRACDIHIAMHKGISDWKCEECNKLFPSRGSLQRHNNIHTGKCNYQCDQCGKSFIHTSSFKMHKLSHTGAKPHACDTCGLKLMSRSHLKRHQRIHSGEKRHECQVCGKKFSERYNMLAHHRSHELAPGGGAAAGASVGAADKGVAPRPPRFRCHFCPARFERRYMLERHSSLEHGRALERPPATPRNTMSKLLKAQAGYAGEASEVKQKVAEIPASESAGAPVSGGVKLRGALEGSSAAGAGAWAPSFAPDFRADY